MLFPGRPRQPRRPAQSADVEHGARYCGGPTKKAGCRRGARREAAKRVLDAFTDEAVEQLAKSGCLGHGRDVRRATNADIEWIAEVDSISGRSDPDSR